MRKRFTWLVPVLSLASVALGLVCSFWPLSLVGVLIAALFGRFALALVCGVLLDVAYGTPVGFLHFAYIPFTLSACAGVGAHYVMRAYVLSAPRDTL